MRRHNRVEERLPCGSSLRNRPTAPCFFAHCPDCYAPPRCPAGGRGHGGTQPPHPLACPEPPARCPYCCGCRDRPASKPKTGDSLPPRLPCPPWSAEPG